MNAVQAYTSGLVRTTAIHVAKKKVTRTIRFVFILLFLSQAANFRLRTRFGIQLKICIPDYQEKAMDFTILRAT
jgi:hypothetical protein